MFTNRSPSADDSSQDDKMAQFPLFHPSLLEEVRSTGIYPHFSLKECGLFAQTSQAAEHATAFLRLLSSVVDAKPESYQQEDATKLAAIAILKRHPELLFRKGMVTDHFGRKIWASPYQLFLGAGDTWALNQVHKEIIPHIENGQAQAEVHFKAQFPTCPWPPTSDMGEEVFYDDRNKAQIEQVITQLKVIVAKINADPCINGVTELDGTKQAIEDLRQIFAPKEGEVIQTGLHFPFAIMKEVYKACQTYGSTWSNIQRSGLFFREVIGAALAATTAVDGQCYKVGLFRLDMEKGPYRRDGLFCRHPKGIPVHLVPVSDKLSRTMSFDSYYGRPTFLTSQPGNYSFYDEALRGWRLGIGVATVAPNHWLSACRQLMQYKSKDIRELLCSHTSTRQHEVTMTLTSR